VYTREHGCRCRVAEGASVASRRPRPSAGQRTPGRPGPRANWKQSRRLETATGNYLILETSVSTYNHNQQEGYWPTVTLIFLLEPTANG